MTDLALFPLNAVLFPGGRMPLRLFEQRYMEMAKRCLREDVGFGVCLILEGSEVGAPAVPHEVGCLARIASWDMPQLGLLHVVARGEQRFRILERAARADGLIEASVELLPQDRDSPVGPVGAQCVRLLERLIERAAEGLFERPYPLESSSWVSARLAELLPLPLALKQELLELADGGERLGRLAALIAR